MEKINAKEVLSTFDKAINELEKGLTPDSLSSTELVRVDDKLKETIRLGLKVKLQYQQRKLQSLIRVLDENKEVDLVRMQLMSNELEKILKMNEAA